MVFYIHDQGARGVTPVDRLVSNRGTPAVSPINRVNPVNASRVVTPVEQQADTLSSYRENERGAGEGQGRRRALFAAEIMTRSVQSLSLNDSLLQAGQWLQRGGFHHLPVINTDKQLCGIISDRDVLRYLANHPRTDAAKVAVSTVMTSRVISASEDTEIRVVAEVMCSQRISALPIIDELDKLQGIVTRSDILKTLIRAAPLEMWI